MQTMRVLDSSGDKVLEFAPDTKAEDTARALFDRLTKNEGRTAFKVNRGDGKPDEKVTDFGQLEQETILVPRVVGG